ncbi:MAG: hypothetical protein AB8F78_00870 [Saprospiraceae bacterium]
MVESNYHSLGMIFFLACSFLLFFSMIWTIYFCARMAGRGLVNQPHQFCIPWFTWTPEAKECARTTESFTFNTLRILLLLAALCFILGMVLVGL